MHVQKKKEKGNKAKGHMPVQALYLRGNKDKQSTLPQQNIRRCWELGSSRQASKGSHLLVCFCFVA